MPKMKRPLILKPLDWFTDRGIKKMKKVKMKKVKRGGGKSW